MPVFAWEQFTIDYVQNLTHKGLLCNFMFWVSDFSKTLWLILLVLVAALFIYGWRRVVMPVIIGIAAAGIGDLVSRRLIKALVMRPRPHYVGQDCSASACWGFVSSHATNVTAAITVLILYKRNNVWWGIPCVLLVGFSRIYLADHFPLDVLGGIILGFLVGVAFFKLTTFIKRIFRLKVSKAFAEVSAAFSKTNH